MNEVYQTAPGLGALAKAPRQETVSERLEIEIAQLEDRLGQLRSAQAALATNHETRRTLDMLAALGYLQPRY